MRPLLLPLTAATISAFGQVLLKAAMTRHGPIKASLSGLLSLFAQPQLIVAMCIYAIAMLMWLQVLSKFPLGVAYSILAFTYAIVPCLAFSFFGEQLNPIQIAGILLILVGVALLGYSYEA